MTDKFKYLLALLSILFIACKKEDDGNSSEKSCRPVLVKYVFPSDTSQNTISEFFYNNDTLIRIEVNKTKFIIDYKYNDLGLLETMARTYGGGVRELDSFEYNSNAQVVRYAMYDGSINGRLHAEVLYEYADNKLSGSHVGIYKPTGDSIFYDERYFYDAVGNITRIAQPSEVATGAGAVQEYDDRNHWLKNVGVPIQVRSFSNIDITERQLHSTIYNNMLKQINRNTYPDGTFYDYVQHSRTLAYNKYNYPIRIEESSWYKEVEYTGCH